MATESQIRHIVERFLRQIDGLKTNLRHWMEECGKVNASAARARRQGVELAMEIVSNMRQAEAGMFDEKHSGASGFGRSEALADAYLALKTAERAMPAVETPIITSPMEAALASALDGVISEADRETIAFITARQTLASYRARANDSEPEPLVSENQRLRRALEPFALVVHSEALRDDLSIMGIDRNIEHLKISHLRAARAALYPGQQADDRGEELTRAINEEIDVDDEFVVSVEVVTDYERGRRDGIAHMQSLCDEALQRSMADELEIMALKARVDDLKLRLMPLDSDSMYR